MSLLAGLGLVACGEDPPSPSEVRSRLTNDLGHILREAHAAIEGGTEQLPGGAALELLGRTLGEDSGIGLRTRAALTSIAPRSLRAPRANAKTGALPADPPYDPAEDIAFLNEQLFSDANHLGEGLYRVPASLVCSSIELDPDGEPVEKIDPECAADLEAARLRIRTSTDDDELRFALQIGADRDEPLTVALTHERLAITIDLDDMERAATELARVLGEELPNFDLAGQATAAIEILGAAHAKATLDIDRAITVAFAEAGADLAGPEALRFSSAAARVLAIELEGPAKRGAVALGLGATKLALPLGDELEPEQLELDLPGLSGEATFGAGEPLELVGLSLGGRTTKLSINGETAATFDLNANDGRKLDATLSVDAATGVETLAVTPVLDLAMTRDHVRLGAPAPVYDVTRLRFEGRLSTHAESDAVRIDAGSLEIVTNPAEYGASAAAGDCVSTSEATTPEGEPYLEFLVGPCL